MAAALLAAGACAALSAPTSAAGPKGRGTGTFPSAALLSDLQRIAGRMAAAANSSVAVGVCRHNSSFAVAGGSRDNAGTPASPADRYGWGSVTKTFTGAAILRLVAEGRIALDDRASKYIDPVLQQKGGPYTSMHDLFTVDEWARGGQPDVERFSADSVTIRNLLSMQSGIPDYDTDAFRQLQYSHPDLDWTPSDILDLVHGPLLFRPGQPVPCPPGVFCPQPGYSSVNFLLLGHVLQHFANVSWQEYRQGAVVPSWIPDIVFPTRGSFAEYVAPLRPYDRFSFASKALAHGGDFDASHVSATPGWTAANVIMPVESAAQWLYALYGPENTVLPQRLVDEMLPRAGGYGNAYYGLATMNLTGSFGGGTGSPPEFGVYGHMGDTNGFSSVAAYFPAAGLAVTLAGNVEGVQTFLIQALCQVYNRVLDDSANRSPRSCTYPEIKHGPSGRPWQSVKCDCQ